MKHKTDQVMLIFVTLFAAVLLISNVVTYFVDPESFNLLITICYGCGLVCIIYAWIQHFRGKNKENE